ncbi:MAG: hypothetical protein ACKOHN_05950 [Actinomycetota bacterium]
MVVDDEEVLAPEEIAELPTVTVKDVTDALTQAFPGSVVENENG